MTVLLRAFGLVLIDLFYRVIALTGRERVPAGGPLVFVANHPNGLLDPLVARVALGRPLAFLAKSTFFRNPVGRAAMAAFSAIPVYRPRDGEDTAKNDETFRRCRELLAGGGSLMLFPEGTSHSDPAMKPLKTGAARIAITSGLEALRIVPLGLLYEDKGVFRSRVAVQVGEPIAVAPFLAAPGGDERERVQALTEAIHGALSKVVLEADSDELWRGFLAVAAWTDARATHDVAVREERARALADRYRRLAADAPDRAEALVTRARRFARILRLVGIEDPWRIEQELQPRRLASFLATQLLLLPLAVIGAAAGWLPYRLTGIVVNRMVKDSDLTGTSKALLGSVLLLVTWAAEAMVVAVLAGWGWGLVALVGAPLGGFAAIRFQERIEARREALRGWWLRANRSRITEEIARRRDELARDVERALAGE